MDAAIIAFLLQDGVINGAIYALIAIALVLVFAVTRVIFVPQGEFVAFAALTMAALEQGRIPPTIYLLGGFGVLAFVSELVWSRGKTSKRRLLRNASADLLFPLAVYAILRVVAPMRLGPLPEIVLTLLLVAPLGPLIYRIAFQPLARANVLVLFIAAIGVHLSLTGLGLGFFGPEGVRTEPLVDGDFPLGDLIVSGQSVVVITATAALLCALAWFFGHTLEGKALRACASNRLGARLVGIPMENAGRIAFLMAALIGALTGVLIGPLTTIYYDSGFLIGLKGFVAAIIGGLVGYPLSAAAAFAVGVAEAFSSFWASAYKEVIVFTLIIPVLLWRSLRTAPSEGEDA